MSFSMRVLDTKIICIRCFHTVPNNLTKPVKETAGELIKRTLEEIKKHPVDEKTRDAAIKKLLEDAQQIDPSTVGASERLVDRVAVAIHSAKFKN